MLNYEKESLKALPHHSSLIIHNFLAPLAAGGKGELQEEQVVREFRTTATDGKSNQVAHYNLDVIISVGKGNQATGFR